VLLRIGERWRGREEKERQRECRQQLGRSHGGLPPGR
jgi:hypothetical protein